MLSFLKRRAFITALGLLLISLFIWYAGPYFAFADRQPLESSTARLIAIALVVAIWGALVLLRRLRAQRASNQLVAAVVDQSRSEQRPSAEVVQLRERFEEAVATLQKGRRGGRSLYELPWYVIIGAPGSGKTTALVNSGLHFPMEQRMGKGALRGVGGTRNCDWWFTDEAVFLDTAGRYTTQDSDESADSTAWAEFLALLKKYRKRRPVNGVILTISARDLMVQGAAEQEAYVAAARRRLDELHRELKIQLPVYLLVTKCDLVAGFTEYFDDLNQEGRAQVWGVTFPYEQTMKGEAAGAVGTEFEALVHRLNERLFPRLEEERDVRRRARIFAFPQQMAALGDALSSFVSEVFRSTKFDRQVLLRGFYCTSGTQEGTPIDRLLGSIGRRFAVGAEVVAPPVGKGKAYFIERFLKQVLLAESGLAGVNRRLELQKAAVQLGAYVAVAVVAVLTVLALSWSYARNQAYLTEVAAEASHLREALAASADAAMLDRLEAVRAVVDLADQHRDGVPWSMRWGLYQGRSIVSAARDAYVRELDATVFPQVADLVKSRLVNSVAEPINLFSYLKAYLMLGEAGHLDKDFLFKVADTEWRSQFAEAPDDAAALSRHFRSYLDYSPTLRLIPIDQPLVDQARRSLSTSPDAIPRLVYESIKLGYPAEAGGVRLDSLGAEQVLRRKSGTPFSREVPSLYTRTAFAQIAAKDAAEMEKAFATDRWVWGEARPSKIESARLRAGVIDIYEKDYIATWDAVLGDVGLVPANDLAGVKRALRALSGTTSPLRFLLKTVDEHTFLAGPGAKPSTGVVSAARDRINNVLRSGQAAMGLQAVTPGAQVTAHFKPIHDLVAGGDSKAQIDALLGQIRQLLEKLEGLGDQVGGRPPGPSDIAAVGEASQALKESAATVHPAVGAVATEAGAAAEKGIRGGAGRSLSERYQEEVARPCAEAVSGRYPFVTGSAEDIPLRDFGRIFGPNGVFDRFFKDNLSAYVNQSTSRWSWRVDASGAAVGLSGAVLQQFQDARDIREIFFGASPDLPEVGFTLTPVDLDSKARLFKLDVNGQSLVYQHDTTERVVKVNWPGTATGSAVITIENLSGQKPNQPFSGAWAWFRLLGSDVTSLQAESAVRHVVTFRVGGHQARVLLEALSVRNPFGKSLLSRFRCQA